MAITYNRLMQLGDQGKVWSGFAREVISGGYIVCASGADDVVNLSGADSFDGTEVQLATVEGMTSDTVAVQSVVGLAVTTAASGAKVAFVSQGVFVVEAITGITAGYPVSIAGSVNYFNDTATGSLVARYFPVGRALTGASASDTFAIVRLNF